MAHRRRPRNARGPHPKGGPGKGNAPKARPSRPARPVQRPRRGSLFSRNGRRRAVIALAASSLLAIMGIAVAGAVSGQKDTAASAPQDTPAATRSAAATSPAPASPTPATRTPKPTPTAESRPTAKSDSEQTAKPRHTKGGHAAAPDARPTPSPTGTGCPSAAERVRQARTLLWHPGALPQASVATAGPRTGTLATADIGARTITLYLRDCSEETPVQLAVAWTYVAGQFVDVEGWDAATRDRWRHLRGGAALATTTELRQDAAAVFAFWETGTTKWWQSPVAPPPPKRLPTLAKFLRMP